MLELLRRIHENQIEMSFLLPAMGNTPIKGRIEAVEPDKATIVSTIESRTLRIVTHPNSVILVEQVNG